MRAENKYFWKEFSGHFLYDCETEVLRFTAKGKKELWPQLLECGFQGARIHTLGQFKQEWYALCLFRIKQAQQSALSSSKGISNHAKD